MSDMQLECATSPNAAPDEWALLEPLNGGWLTSPIETTAADWFLPCFQMLDGQGQDHLYTFEKWSTEVDGVAIYTKEKDAHQVAQHVGVAAVRKVPTNLVFNCDLTIIEESYSFRAFYTTLAGREVLRVEDTLAPILTLEHIVSHIAEAAKNMGLLQSRNQELHLLLNGSVIELPEEAVLWCEDAPIGWLQRNS
eukprot:s362_g8.t1